MSEDREPLEQCADRIHALCFTLNSFGSTSERINTDLVKELDMFFDLLKNKHYSIQLAVQRYPHLREAHFFLKKYDYMSLIPQVQKFINEMEK